MANCNKCTKMYFKVEEDEGIMYTSHICAEHDVVLRYTPKKFNGYIWPCTECSDKDFKKK